MLSSTRCDFPEFSLTFVHLCSPVCSLLSQVELPFFSLS